MIAIITPNTDTFTNPTMVSLIHYLKGIGENIIMFGPVQEPTCPDEFNFMKVEKVTFKLSFRNPKFWLAQIKSYLKVTKVLKNEQFNTIFAVDPLGLVIAGRIKKFLCPKARLSYLSYELFFTDELFGHYLKLKKKEIAYSGLIDTLLTQDETRRNLLFAENGFSLPESKVALIPVSPAPIMVDSPTDIHNMMNIEAEKKLIVYSGSIGEWCGTQCVIDALKSGHWPNNWHLVFHCRQTLEKGNTMLNELVSLDKDPAVPFSLHTEPFGPMSELATFLGGFDAALALYFPNRTNPYYGKNMEEIGLSSGKFAMYMMLGLPTIVTSCKIYDLLLKQYNFGATVKDSKSLCSALKYVKFDRSGAKKLYEEVLKPDNKEFRKLI